MTAEPHQDAPILVDPTDIFIWDEPVQLPYDRVIWKATGDVRGNFPGYMHVDDGIVRAEIRLTPNVLGIVGERDSFGIPSSSIQRVGLESGGEPQQPSILSVDYVDALGQTRRFWLRIDKRRALSAVLGRDGFATGFRGAGVADLRLEPVVPGFTRMRPSNLRERRESPYWSVPVTACLASNDYLAELSGWPDHVELRYAEYVLALPYTEVIGLTCPAPADGADHRTTFLTFKDAGLLLSLKLRIPEHPQPEHASASEVVDYLQSHGVRQYDAEDRLAFFDLAPDEPADPDSQPLFVFAESDHSVSSNGNGATGPNGSSHSVLSRSANFAEMRPSSHAQPAAPERDALLRPATRREVYGALLVHVAEGLRVYHSLYQQGLLTDDEFAHRRGRAVEELQRVHRLIQIGLLHDVDLLTDDEFEQSRRPLIHELTGLETGSDGA